MSLWNELTSFGSAVWSYWGVLVGGTATTLAAILIERRRGKEISWPAYRRVLAAFVVIAIFLAWRDEFRGQADAKTDLKAQRARADQLAEQLDRAGRPPTSDPAMTQRVDTLEQQLDTRDQELRTAERELLTVKLEKAGLIEKFDHERAALTERPERDQAGRQAAEQTVRDLKGDFARRESAEDGKRKAQRIVTASAITRKDKDKRVIEFVIRLQNASETTATARIVSTLFFSNSALKPLLDPLTLSFGPKQMLEVQPAAILNQAAYTAFEAGTAPVRALVTVNYDSAGVKSTYTIEGLADPNKPDMGILQQSWNP